MTHTPTLEVGIYNSRPVIKDSLGETIIDGIMGNQELRLKRAHMIVESCNNYAYQIGLNKELLKDIQEAADNCAALKKELEQIKIENQRLLDGFLKKKFVEKLNQFEKIHETMSHTLHLCRGFFQGLEHQSAKDMWAACNEAIVKAESLEAK